MDEEFRLQRATLIRELASNTDPFTRKRLLALVERYETPPRPLTPVPVGGIGLAQFCGRNFSESD
jgi:hypothetical protein